MIHYVRTCTARTGCNANTIISYSTISRVPYALQVFILILYCTDFILIDKYYIKNIQNNVVILQDDNDHHDGQNPLPLPIRTSIWQWRHLVLT